jgi:hypothetical protein
MNPSRRPPGSVRFGRCLLAGLFSGIVAAVLANLSAAAISRVSELRFEELNFVSIAIASVGSNLIGSLFFYGFARWTTRPVLWFVVAALAAATADSVVTILRPPHPDFGKLANPLHYIVAMTAVILLPAFAPSRSRLPPPIPETLRRPSPPPLPRNST